MDLTFNVVFIPGTARYLQLFALSLLKRSSCSLRLVANGCPPEEKRLLERLCEKDHRLAFLSLPSDGVMRHGETLSYLQTMECSDHFCFIDSDVLATGDFVGELSTYVDQYTGVFSGSFAWCREEDEILPEGMLSVPGWFSRTADGLCLGNSFFAIYDNSVLSQIIQSTGVGFQPYRWGDMPTTWQSQIAKMGLQKRAYDTGKVLNLLLLAQGGRLVWSNSSSLHHLGSISTHVAGQARSPRERSFRRLKRLWRRARAALERRAVKETELVGARIGLQQRRMMGGRTEQYFGQMLQALFENLPLPPTPSLGDPEIEQKVESLAAAIASAYEEFGGQLVR